MEDQDTYTITGKPLRPHEWVRIKSVVTAGDQAWIQNHAATMGGTKKDPKPVLTLGDVHLALVKRMVVTWQLTKTIFGPDGSTPQEVQIPCTEQEIEKLPLKIFNFIKAKIDELNADEEEEEDEDFLPAANGHLESEERSLVPMKISRKRG